jgi:cobalamin-dependent methionine synthase I
MDTKEVLRYLGYHGTDADEQVASQIAQVSEETAAVLNAKNVFGIWDCQIEADTVSLGADGLPCEIKIKSQNLASHLNGCNRVVLMAATLGTEADTLIRKYSAMDMEKALIAQAVCAVMIEDYCDTVVCEAAQSPMLENLYPTGRFSPGYGDFDISWQKDMLKLLNCEKQIALTLTDGYMLIPSKSVTAIVGFGKERAEFDKEKKCARCTNTQCAYRKEN